MRENQYNCVVYTRGDEGDNLTYGKEYNTFISLSDNDYYIIINDSDIHTYYLKTYFITAFEWRERKINKVNR